MTIEEIFQWVQRFNDEEKRSDTETTEAYIDRLLGTYLDKLKELSCPINDCNEWEHLLSKVKDLNDQIHKSLQYYSLAKIAESIKECCEILQSTKFKTIQLDPNKEEDKNWYRMRLQEENKRTFPASEMFHIPFDMRYKVNLERFSISGYPCLYISHSVLATWEEMRKPKITDYTVSRLELLQPIELLDLRAPSSRCGIDKDNLPAQIITIPLVLSCSVRVAHSKGSFKPEYIMPQLLMIAIANRDDACMGCAYTSSMRDSVFDWEEARLSENLAIPVRGINDTRNLCPMLCSMFKVTDSTNYEFETYKEPFSTLFIEEGPEELINCHPAGNYGESVFGQLERRLKKMQSKRLQ